MYIPYLPHTYSSFPRTVIDFCLTKNLVCDVETNFTSLQVQWAAKANCVQRMGRAGRVSDGRVYRFVTRRFYRDKLSDHGVPEMLVRIGAGCV